jgi:hypothetical protein
MRVRTCLALIATTVMLAACGDDGGSASVVESTAASTAASTTTTTAAVTTTAPPATTLPSTTAASTSTVPGDEAPDALAPLLESGAIAVIAADTGTIRRFEFASASAEEAVAALTVALGEPSERTDLSECGEGPLVRTRWSTGLNVYAAADGVVAGWAVDPDASATFTTADGIGLRSTRADLAASYPNLTVDETTLGFEWTANVDTVGSIAGLLTDGSQAAVVTHVWAGAVCLGR